MGDRRDRTMPPRDDRAWPGVKRLHEPVSGEQELEQRIREEATHHLEELVEQLERDGLDPGAARREAARRFGSVDRVSAQCRAIDGRNQRSRRRRDTLAGLVQSLRYGVRSLRRHRAFTAAAVVCLAVGLGAVTTVFSLLNGLLLRPLTGIRDQESLMVVKVVPDASYPTYLNLRDAGLFAELAAFSGALMSVSGPGGEPEVVLGHTVSGNYFSALGTRPAAGRLLEPADDRPGALPVAVLSHRLWRSRFGGSPTVLGSTLSINGLPFTVVGVTEPGFLGTFVGFQIEVFAPLSTSATMVGGMPGLQPVRVAAPATEPALCSDGFLELTGRLRPDAHHRRATAATRAATAASLQVAAARLREEHPAECAGLELRLYETSGIDLELLPAVTGLVVTLLAVAILLLLLACVPVVNLLFARITHQVRELALRTALGASRRQIASLVLSESLLLGLLGGVAGVLLASFLARALHGLEPALPVRLALDFRPDTRVLLFALVAALATGLLFGLVPALRLARADLVPALRSGHLGGRDGGARLRRLLVVVQVALSALLLVVGGLFARAATQIHTLDPGFAVDGLFVVSRLDLNLLRFTEEQAARFQERLVERLREQPGVASASLVARVPLSFFGASSTPIQVDSFAPPEGHEGFDTDFTAVWPGYFETMAIELLSGRDFTEQDRSVTPRVAVVNRALAERYFGGDAIGRRFRVTSEDYTIVGMVETGRYRSFSEPARPFFYLSYLQHPSARSTVVVRSQLPLAALAPQVRTVLHELEPDLALPELQTARRFLATTLLPQRVAAAVAGTMGLVGLLLAAVGVYGVVAFAASQRQRELGIRVSLGARRADVVRLIVGEGSRLVALGLALGLLAALGAGRLIAGMLHGVPPTDPLTWAVITGALLLVALLAAYLPARRAATLDPVRCLRDE